MPETLVSLDLETTGLDSNNDAILEIGAVKFSNERLEDEFHALVNPGRRIPAFVTQLTGITNDMVAEAPPLAAVLPQLTEFMGTLPVLGHNVGFDLRFVRKQGVLQMNAPIDTMDLAATVLPAAGRYSLGALATELGVALPATHRALDDARVTCHVYLALLKRARELPRHTLAELVRHGSASGWGANLPLQELLQARSSEKDDVGSMPAKLFDDPAPEGPALQPRDQPLSLDIDALQALFKPGGALECNLRRYEHRAEQVDMMSAVATALTRQHHLLVEAGTGTGKSLAYLIPAIQWAWSNELRVVISTNTINLQDQLMKKDLPALRKILDMPFRAALLKGRSNYVCPRRLDKLRRRGPRDAAEMRVLAKLLLWLPDSKSGDRAEITLTGPEENSAWLRLSAEDEGCTTERCAAQMGGICPFYRARRAAETAHVIVVNHALLLADVASENRVLPDYSYLILDEAHHLEAATTEGLSFVARQRDFEGRLRELGGKKTSGLLGEVLKRCASAMPMTRFKGLEGNVAYAYEAIDATMTHSGSFFDALENFAREVDEGGNPAYDKRVRVVPDARASAEWEQVEKTWEHLHLALTPVIDSLTAIARRLAELEVLEPEEREELAASLSAAARRAMDFDVRVNALVTQVDKEQICWVELSRDDKKLALRSAPLDVGPLVEEHLWFGKKVVVMTSATLATAGDFNYIKSRLRAHDADELAVGSPFDYEKSTMVYLPDDIPEPYDKKGHQDALQQGLVQLSRAIGGRTLVLFTSYAQLRDTAQAIRGPLEQEGIEVYAQMGSASRHQLLHAFSNAEKAVLLGARSFWEGVDVPGPALSVLVIARLPFSVPSDPIVAARSEDFENPFLDYSVPEAVMRFRQGFGRLIRSRTDRGVVVVFDRRLVSKPYGSLFLKSLPGCEWKPIKLSLLPEEAVKWIDGAE